MRGPANATEGFESLVDTSAETAHATKSPPSRLPLESVFMSCPSRLMMKI